MSGDEPMNADELAQLRETCLRTIVRLPSIGEWEEWSRKLEAAQTGDQLQQLVIQLARLVEMYRHYRGIDIVHNPTIFDHIAAHNANKEV